MVGGRGLSTQRSIHPPICLSAAPAGQRQMYLWCAMVDGGRRQIRSRRPLGVRHHSSSSSSLQALRSWLGFQVNHARTRIIASRFLHHPGRGKNEQPSP
jgi:hypothetical protein